MIRLLPHESRLALAMADALLAGARNNPSCPHCAIVARGGAAISHAPDCLIAGAQWLLEKYAPDLYLEALYQQLGDMQTAIAQMELRWSRVQAVGTQPRPTWLAGSGIAPILLGDHHYIKSLREQINQAMHDAQRLDTMARDYAARTSNRDAVAKAIRMKDPLYRVLVSLSSSWVTWLEGDARGDEAACVGCSVDIPDPDTSIPVRQWLVAHKPGCVIPDLLRLLAEWEAPPEGGET